MVNLKGGKMDYDDSLGPANCRKYSFSWNNCWINLFRAMGGRSQISEEKESRRRIVMYVADDLQKRLNFIDETHEYSNSLK